MVSGTLSGKTCLITGASRGIGRAIAIAYAKEGANLILSGRDEAKLNELYNECQKYSKSCSYFTCDLSTLEDMKKFTSMLSDPNTVPNNSNGIDVLVNNAGYMNTDGVSSANNIDDWAKMMNINLMAPMHITNYVVPSMIEKKSGAIINIGSLAATEGMSAVGMYSASKWGIRGFSHHCQLSLKPYNIKVMLINPGFVATDMVSSAPINMDKVIQPDDIAEVALLPFKTSAYCCPEMITVKVTGMPFINN